LKNGSKQNISLVRDPHPIVQYGKLKKKTNEMYEAGLAINENYINVYKLARARLLVCIPYERV